jgi:hypothetical protein
MKAPILFKIFAIAILLQNIAFSEKENFVGFQFVSLISNWPGLHLNYEKNVSENYGVLVSIAGYKWNPEMSLRNDSVLSIYGASLKTEVRRYFSTSYILVPLAYTAFDKNLLRGTYKYGSIGFGAGKKRIGRRLFIDTNLQVLITNKNPVKDIEQNKNASGEGHQIGIEFIPNNFSWFLNSVFPNMNIDANIIVGYAW